MSTTVAKKQRRNIRKRRVVEDESDDETVVQHKTTKQRRDTDATKNAPSVFAHEASGTVQCESDQGATRHLETETEFHRDARARREKQLKADLEDSSQGGDSNKQYKGLASYVDFAKGLKKETSIAQEKTTGAHGPLRGSTYIRMSARFDYQPDICKDYKETGFCSFGDSCKFLHDRGDYKSGWELEKEWEAERQREKEALQKLADGVETSEEDEASEEDDDLPFACFICRTCWEETKQMPVVTQCKHYFCEKCALKHNAKSAKCYVCDKATRGIFNVAHDVIKRMKKLKDKGGT